MPIYFDPPDYYEPPAPLTWGPEPLRLMSASVNDFYNRHTAPPPPVVEVELVSCDRCGDEVEENQTVVTIRGSTICRNCRTWHYWQCERCDGWNRSGRDCANGCEDDDECEDSEYGCDCSSCSSSGQYLFDYYYKPYPVFHGDGPLFIGPEIEVEVGRGDRDECTAYASGQLGKLGYLKRDSSIGYGFEIVTHPMSYAWAMENFPWDMLKGLRDLGCHTDADSNGIHVHVSRAGFASPCHIYRWMKFIYRNERQVIALARRESDQWASFREDYRRAVKDYAKGERDAERYQAINPTNDATFELRMFASSLDPEEVQAAFGFAAASVEYTRTLTYNGIAKAGGWTWDAFATWVADRPDYAPLTRQITRQLEDAACAF